MFVSAIFQVITGCFDRKGGRRWFICLTTPYLRDVVLTPDGIAKLRQKVLALGVFEEAGQHTLRCQITDVTLPKALTAFEKMLAYLDKVS